MTRLIEIINLDEEHGMYIFSTGEKIVWMEGRGHEIGELFYPAKATFEENVERMEELCGIANKATGVSIRNIWTENDLMDFRSDSVFCLRAGDSIDNHASKNDEREQMIELVNTIRNIYLPSIFNNPDLDTQHYYKVSMAAIKLSEYLKMTVEEANRYWNREDIETMEKQMQEEDDRDELEEALPKLIEGLTWNLSENFRGLSVTEFAGICGEIPEAAEEILNKYDHDIARLIVRAIEQALTVDSVLLERKCNEE